MRVSESSEIACRCRRRSRPCSARPSRETTLSSPGPPRNVSIPPPPNRPSLPAPPLKITGTVDVRRDGGDVVAVAEVEDDQVSAPERAIDGLSFVITCRAAARADAARAELGEADAVAGPVAGERSRRCRVAGVDDRAAAIAESPADARRRGEQRRRAARAAARASALRPAALLAGRLAARLVRRQRAVADRVRVGAPDRLAAR